MDEVADMAMVVGVAVVVLSILRQATRSGRIQKYVQALIKRKRYSLERMFAIDVNEGSLIVYVSYAKASDRFISSFQEREGKEV